MKFVLFCLVVQVLICLGRNFVKLMSIVLNVHSGVQLFLLFGHGRNLVAFNGTGLQKVSPFQIGSRLERLKSFWYL